MSYVKNVVKQINKYVKKSNNHFRVYFTRTTEEFFFLFLTKKNLMLERIF